MQHATFRDRTKGEKYALCNKKQPPVTASPAKGATLLSKNVKKDQQYFFLKQKQGE